jgi:hypothetical protein
MPENEAPDVTMRIRIGDSELEVTGPKEFVEAKIAAFIELNRQSPLPSGRPGVGATPLPDERHDDACKPLSVAQVFKKANAHTDVDRALLAGHYLEYHAKQESFTAGDVKGTIRAAKVSPPGNPNAAIDKNIKKGLMMAAGDRDGKRAFVLTTDGEDAVRAMLQE